MSAFVDFQNVWLAYNDALWAQGQFAVEDLNLQIDEGEFVAIVGPSGCGKSTFMKLTTGLKQPTKGHITIGGEPVTGPLKITGMAFQAPSLLPWRTTLDNVLLPLEIVEPFRASFKAKRKEYAAKARALLESVGLGGYEDKFPWELSGGMQQRASICRALIHEPKMLLLDEPFGALDAFTREELWCALRDLQAVQKFNVILVTHDLPLVTETCERAAIMYAGEIIEVGTAKDIYKSADHHPYTVGLFHSIPNLAVDTPRLSPVDGLMPDPTDLPAGCKFHPRCPRCMDICRSQAPVDYATGEHRIKCHLFKNNGRMM